MVQDILSFQICFLESHQHLSVAHARQDYAIKQTMVNFERKKFLSKGMGEYRKTYFMNSLIPNLLKLVNGG